MSKTLEIKEDSKEEESIIRSGIQKAIRVGTKVSSIFEKIPTPISKLVKSVSYTGSVIRYNKCIERGNTVTVCVVSETSNRITRTVVQAGGVASVTAGAVAMATPTGATQIIGAIGATNGIKMIYDADEIGNAVGRSVEKIFEKKKSILDSQKKGTNITIYVPEKVFNTIPKELHVKGNSRAFMNHQLTKVTSNSRKNAEIVKRTGDDIMKMSTDIIINFSDLEKFKVSPTSFPDMFKQYKEEYFDGASPKGYMKGVKQPTTNIEPEIVVYPRLPDISVSCGSGPSGLEFVVLLPLITIPL